MSGMIRSNAKFTCYYCNPPKWMKLIPSKFQRVAKCKCWSRYFDHLKLQNKGV